MNATEYRERIEEALFGNFDVAEDRALALVRQRKTTLRGAMRRGESPATVAAEIARRNSLVALERTKP